MRRQLKYLILRNEIKEQQISAKKNQEKQKNQDKSKKSEFSKNYISYPLLNVFQPEKMVFAFTYDTKTEDKIHDLKPFMGV